LAVFLAAFFLVAFFFVAFFLVALRRFLVAFFLVVFFAFFLFFAASRGSPPFYCEGGTVTYQCTSTRSVTGFFFFGVEK
jgi:hypothetical protein